MIIIYNLPWYITIIIVDCKYELPRDGNIFSATRFCPEFANNIYSNRSFISHNKTS